VDYRQGRSEIWRHPPLAWLPVPLKRPPKETVWSEVVTP
jgi:hypothetical protein